MGDGSSIVGECDGLAVVSGVGASGGVGVFSASAGVLAAMVVGTDAGVTVARAFASPCSGALEHAEIITAKAAPKILFVFAFFIAVFSFIPATFPVKAYYFPRRHLPL